MQKNTYRKIPLAYTFKTYKTTQHILLEDMYINSEIVTKCMEMTNTKFMSFIILIGGK